MTAPQPPERAYPLAGPIDIAAFTSVLYALEEVLVSFSYPRPTAADMPELGVALGGFLYGVAR